MQRLCIVAAAKLDWDYNLTQHADTRRTGQTTYLILLDVALGFLSDLQRGRQDKWLHATCYDTLRVKPRRTDTDVDLSTICAADARPVD